jgi:HSP20 family molecular chaperone IbpA
MSDTSSDKGTSIDDMIRRIMEMSGAGHGAPVIIGIQIIIPPAGPAGNPGQLVRGDGTEPEIEVHTFGNRVTLVTELPGISPGNIQVLFREDRVFIWAKDGGRHYRASAKVPPAQKGTVEISCKHGVLEISYVPVTPPEPEFP